MINIYEWEDAKINRKKYIKSNAILELEEPYWIQFKVNNLRKILAEANIPLSRQEVLYQKGYSENNIIEFYADGNPYYQKLVAGYALQGYLSMQ